MTSLIALNSILTNLWIHLSHDFLSPADWVDFASPLNPCPGKHLHITHLPTLRKKPTIDVLMYVDWQCQRWTWRSGRLAAALAPLLHLLHLLHQPAGLELLLLSSWQHHHLFSGGMEQMMVWDTWVYMQTWSSTKLISWCLTPVSKIPKEPKGTLADPCWQCSNLSDVQCSDIYSPTS